MGAVRFIYDETINQLKHCALARELNLEGTRKIMQGHLRYCLQGNTLYLPQDESIVKNKHRICWGRIRSEEFEEHPWIETFDTPLDINPLNFHRPFTGIGFGILYSKRHRETKNGRIPVNSFISESIIDAIGKNPDSLEDITKDDFESLMAELFASKGFDVDLYRGSKDNGIDFLAIKTDAGDPIITCVQCKHPDKAKPGKKRRSLPVATVREIYGVAKAYDLPQCLAITSSTYSPCAKKFADLKPDEIKIANAEDVIEWVYKYRWNRDE